MLSIFAQKVFSMKAIKGDRELEHVLSIRHKSLRVNLNEHIYGTFAEIGAGQETVRHCLLMLFFQLLVSEVF